MTKQNGFSLTPKTDINISWGGIPDAILSFPVSIGLSGQMIVDREATIALPPEEKAIKLFEFRVKVLADVMESAPYLVRISELNTALQTKIDVALFNDGDVKITPEQREKISAEVGLTEEEIADLKHPFPEWPEEGELKEQVLEYFGREDERGRKVFHALIEDAVTNYFLWATPRPTISVSAFMLGKRGTFTAS